MPAIQAILNDHLTGYLVSALLTCTMTAVTVTILCRRTGDIPGGIRVVYALLVAVVAGLGVWTTHFLAILGYRPEAMLGFDTGVTALSAAIAVLLVGAPTAASALLHSRGARAALGVLAGLGVGAMHFIGMGALENCVINYDPPTIFLAVLAGPAAFAGALSLGRRSGSGWLRSGLITVGVCGVHFTAILGTELQFLSPEVSPQGREAVSALIAAAAIGLALVGTAAIATARRLETRKHQAAEAEARQTRQFSIALQNMSNGLIMVDEDARVALFNDRLREMFGLHRDDLFLGQPYVDFLRAVGRQNGWTDKRVRSGIAMHQAWMCQGGRQRRDVEFDHGRVFSISFQRMAEGGATLTFEDLTEHRAAQKAAEHLACHDSLTGLPNRESFRAHLQSRLAGEAPVAILLLDLNRFKTVNETLGQAVGDSLLAEVARRLGRALDSESPLFRLAGDEMAIVPRDTDVAYHEAERVLAAFEAPFTIGTHSIPITCSVGMATSQPGETAEHLIQKADLTLYRVKVARQNRVEVYEDGMMEQALERREIENDLIRAVAEDQLSLHYQPLFALPERRLIGFEALVRWRHPRKGMISPAQFIPLAETNGQIHEIGEWVLDAACRQAARWPAHLHVAVNVSAVQVRSPDIVALVAAALKRHSLHPGRLELELTETAMVEDGHLISRSLRSLRRLGVGIAMDDFGTGYSSLAHLRDFELDRIKIDRSFVATKADDRGAQAVARAVTSMARDLSILTLGEGVETEEQLARLMDLGCDAAQGYLLGRPVDAAAADRLICLTMFEADREDESRPVLATGT